MLESLTQGLAAAILLGLLATALAVLRAGGRGLLGRRMIDDPTGLAEPTLCLLALVPTWLIADRAGAFGWEAGAGVLALWPVAALALPAMQLLWSLTPLGLAWRAMALDPEAARRIGLPGRPAALLALLLGLLLTLIAGLVLHAMPEAGDLPVVIASVALVVAVPADRLALAAGLGLAIGLLDGLAEALPAPWPGLTGPLLLLLLLLPRLALELRLPLHGRA